MKTMLSVGLVLLFCYGSVVLGGEHGERHGVIVCLGDSLTAGLGVKLEEGYPAQLEKRLLTQGHNFRVVNAGVSGETSSGTLSRLDWILVQKPDIVILEIGANDGLRGIDTQLLENNLTRILERLNSRGTVVVLAGMQMAWNLGEEYTRSFNEVYPRVAKASGVIFMPFFLEGVATVPELNNSDAIHPNRRGYSLITTNILPYVIEAIERLEK